MRPRRRRLALFLLLVAPLVAAVAVDTRAKPGSVQHLADDGSSKQAPAAPPIPKAEPSNKDAPVDGLDGRPKVGPFVEKPKKPVAAVEDLTVGQKPVSEDVGAGSKEKPEPDSVMEDRGNRDASKKGPTGLEGGISEKERERKAKEEQGQYVQEQRKPIAATAQHDDKNAWEEGRNRVHVDAVTTGKPGDRKEDHYKEKDGEGTFKPLEVSLARSTHVHTLGDESNSLQKPANLPDKPHDMPHPAPPGVLDTSNQKEPPAKPISSGGLGQDHQHSDGSDDEHDPDFDNVIIQPLHAAFLSFTMIIMSEIGDKTFLIACLMAMRHSRLLVFSAALSALFAMTVLSAIFGHAVPHIFSERLTHAAAALLFLVFGLKLLRDGWRMDPADGVGDEMKEVEQELAEKEHSMQRGAGGSRRRSHVSAYALEAGIRVGRGRNGGGSGGSVPHAATPSPSPSPSRRRGAAAAASLLAGAQNLAALLLSPAWVQTFVMTFLGEWGDRSQIATIAMAAGQDYWFVTAGAVLGHAVCTGVAVLGGRLVAGRISMRVVTLAGGAAFLLFAVVYAIEAIWQR